MIGEIDTNTGGECFSEDFKQAVAVATARGGGYVYSYDHGDTRYTLASMRDGTFLHNVPSYFILPLSYPKNDIPHTVSGVWRVAEDGTVNRGRGPFA